MALQYKIRYGTCAQVCHIPDSFHNVPLLAKPFPSPSLPTLWIMTAIKNNQPAINHGELYFHMFLLVFISLIALTSFLGLDLIKSSSSMLYLFICCLSLSTHRSATKLKTTIIDISSIVYTSHVLSHTATYYIPIKTHKRTLLKYWKVWGYQHGVLMKYEKLMNEWMNNAET